GRAALAALPGRMAPALPGNRLGRLDADQLGAVDGALVPADQQPGAVRILVRAVFELGACGDGLLHAALRAGVPMVDSGAGVEAPPALALALPDHIGPALLAD